MYTETTLKPVMECPTQAPNPNPTLIEVMEAIRDISNENLGLISSIRSIMTPYGSPNDEATKHEEPRTIYDEMMVILENSKKVRNELAMFREFIG